LLKKIKPPTDKNSKKASLVEEKDKEQIRSIWEKTRILFHILEDKLSNPDKTIFSSLL